MNAEGWYVDPFGTHADRWFSDGTPTKLVRDGTVTSYDAPPSTEYDGTLQPSADAEPTDGADLIRADSPNPTPDYGRAAMEVWDQTAGLI
ncbi:hypothetical protein Back2_27780 [Nocardioides baekrokdamisoli]|uniref:Uncharacterized protein n=1 Tax=Nocardioides baekrokdamisoli TaxID=1804624 RepID=A0A3G9IXS5_9ACTN|nr:hypothetical protein [Nocardioides baekrokdamisoli]BBH18491.1 hypothetical protein Back2_27780 [Nocardioides baekrokdamisoli]